MASSSFASLAAMIAGGAAAIYVDREYGAEYSQKIKLSDTNTLTITPGAMGAAALLVGLAFVPGSSPMLKSVLTGLAGGAAVYEGANLVEDQLFPLLGMPKQSVTGPQIPANSTQAPMMAAGQFPRGVPRWQTNAALRSLGRVG